jgi:hypothetical protein
VTARTGTALGVALVAVFALITVSVVNARDPLDGAVSRSFDAVAASFPPAQATVAGLGCRKRSINYYDCDALVSPTGPPPATTVHYLLRLDDGGCWFATDKREVTPPPVPHQVQGCLVE